MNQPIVIRTPIWNTRSIGIAESKLSEYTRVEIAYQDRSGNRLYPHIYGVKKEFAMKHPKQITRGVALRIIPISSLYIDKERY